MNVYQLPGVSMIVFYTCLSSSSLYCARFKPALPCGLFFKTVSYAAMTFFIFGYHVHEKAILVTLLPLTMLLTPSITKESGLGFKSCRERELWHAVYMQVASGGIAALLPLLMNVEELALKGEMV